MQSIQTIDELRRFVQQTLCEKHVLDPKQFPMEEAILTRAGRPCGLYFCQNGPRLLRAHAVWDGLRDVVAFYDASGARFNTVWLTNGPKPEHLAA
jgi:hypothetical protein